jgi:hypothetical protein
MFRLAWALAIPVVAYGVGQLNFKPGFNLFSTEEDVEAGRQNAQEVAKQMPILHDPQVDRYVTNLGRYLVPFAPNNKPEYAWQFQVVNTHDINAFALPGGYIFVNRGTIEAAQDEAELAGVIAHEEGHVVMRHGTHQATEVLFAKFGLGILGGGGSRLGQLTQAAVGAGVNSLSLRNSRGMEAQADQVGAYVVYRAGYDPHALPQFFEIIQQRYPQRTIQFLSDHPNPGNRIKAVDAEIPQLGPEKQWKEDSPEFQQVKARVAGLPSPPKTKPAQAANGSNGEFSGTDVTPSSGFRTFNHSEYRISYPDNWQIYGDENSAVTIGPASGVSRNAVVLGVIISEYQPEDTAPGKLDNATHQLVDQLRQSNSELRVVGHDESITVNGVAARSVEMIALSPAKSSSGASQREYDWLVTVQRPDGSLLYLVFIAPESSSGRARPVFEAMLRSLEMK